MKRILLAAIFVFTGSSPSWAYLDPGTGSMMLQGLAASAAVAAGVISVSWQRIKHLALRILGRAPIAEKDPEK